MGAVMDESPRRDDRLLVAVACSLLLHLGLLALLPTLLEESRKVLELPKLTARLVEPAPQAPRAIEPPAPESPQPTPKIARPAPQKPVPSVPQVAPPVIAVPPTPSAPPGPFVVPAPVTQQPAPPAAAAPPAAQPGIGPAAPVSDAASIKLYSSELAMIAHRNRRYPRVAVDNNWEGKVHLRMAIGTSGAIASLRVEKSSGFAALDEEAQRMFRAAHAQLPVPPALLGREFALNQIVDFRFEGK